MIMICTSHHCVHTYRVYMTARPYCLETRRSCAYQIRPDQKECWNKFPGLLLTHLVSMHAMRPVHSFDKRFQSRVSEPGNRVVSSRTRSMCMTQRHDSSTVTVQCPVSTWTLVSCTLSDKSIDSVASSD